MLSKSKDHLETVDETYIQHMFFALKFSLCCFKAGVMALLHALIPAMFQTGASEEIKRLAKCISPDVRDL